MIINKSEDGLDLLGNIYYQGFDKLIIHEKNITPDFFNLKTGIAGEVLQKFSNYRVRLVIVGDFSKYKSSSLREFLVGRLNRPTARLAAGIALRDQAHACVDISDGLLADLGHICSASGVGAEIEAALLPRSSALLGLYDQSAALQFALSGGDDYELCFCVPASRLAQVQADLSRVGGGATRIGRIVAGEGVRVRGQDGAWLELATSGWEHFA